MSYNCFRSGRNDCVISSGIKSCIPCRLQKCLQVRTINWCLGYIMALYLVPHFELATITIAFKSANLTCVVTLECHIVAHSHRVWVHTWYIIFWVVFCVLVNCCTIYSEICWITSNPGTIQWYIHVTHGPACSRYNTLSNKNIKCYISSSAVCVLLVLLTLYSHHNPCVN